MDTPINNSKKVLNNLSNDIDIIKEAINNGDTRDALQMLDEMKIDLDVLALIL